MDIIFPERRNIMRKNVLPIFIVLSITMVISFAGGYYATKLFTKNNNVQNENAAAETTKLLSSNDLVMETTEILKRLTYTVNGATLTRETTEKAPTDILGMDENAASKYFTDKGFVMLEFTSKRVIIKQDINSWPPKCFIVKENGNVIGIYESDEQGNLKLKENTDIELDELPEEDRADVRKGKIYETLDEVYWLLDEYNS
jgi:hypothetical protein